MQLNKIMPLSDIYFFVNSLRVAASDSYKKSKLHTFSLESQLPYILIYIHLSNIFHQPHILGLSNIHVGFFHLIQLPSSRIHSMMVEGKDLV